MIAMRVGTNNWYVSLHGHDTPGSVTFNADLGISEYVIVLYTCTMLS
jgi:hypothetical protein